MPSTKTDDKTYDRAYFERWYRDRANALIRGGLIERRVRLALSAAEYLLERPVKSVLDVGCGEGSWRGHLKRLRPGLRYVGVDSSAYAVRRFGRLRNLRRGTVGGLGRLGLRGPFDLVVCSDVLHYVPTADLARGLRAMARLAGGVLFLEFFTREDDSEGDEAGFMPRSAVTYRRLLKAAGLVHAGLHCYVGKRFLARERALVAFERGWAAPRRGRTG
ncbi:MAG: class I SAM-dependent DNA methyltransferase [Candidatus Eiseniibacteriota bacterium]